MSDTAANEAIAHRWHMDLFQAGNLDVADEIFASGFAFHTPLQDGEGTDAAKQLARALRAAFADLAIEHVDTVAAGDKVAIRWTVRATHQGDFSGVPATGAKLQMRGIDIFHLRDGKIVEAWIEWDLLGTLRQMGVISWPPQAAQAGAPGDVSGSDLPST
jgi:steroid delta-isomerase-like uncharacterized protein